MSAPEPDDGDRSQARLQHRTVTAPWRYEATNRDGAREPLPAVVALDVWGVPATGIPGAFVRMARDRRLHTARGRADLAGLRFARLLGTGSGSRFTPRDADLRHWALLTVWADATGPSRLDASGTAGRWAALADEHARFLLRPLSARGRWAGREPFGDPVPRRWDGPVAAVTRARIRTREWAPFWRAVPAVADDLRCVEGLRFTIGIGEAPIGLQGTFSVWRDQHSLTQFARRRSAHVAVMQQTAERQWYAEELFARFALVAATGTYAGREMAPLATAWTVSGSP